MKPVDAGPIKTFKIYKVLQITANDLSFIVHPLLKSIRNTYDLTFIKPLTEVVFNHCANQLSIDGLDIGFDCPFMYKINRSTVYIIKLN